MGIIDQIRSTQEYSLVITEVSQVSRQTEAKSQKLISKADIGIPSFKGNNTLGSS
jgi:hypothetical protein